jgi:hypothetical protein
MFCVLVFLFALYAKTAVYGHTARPNVTPSTAGKLWVSGQKMEVRVFLPATMPLLPLFFLAMFGLTVLRPRFVQSACTVAPPSNLELWHLQRFLRPPPFQS